MIGKGDSQESTTQTVDGPNVSDVVRAESEQSLPIPKRPRITQPGDRRASGRRRRSDSRRAQSSWTRLLENTAELLSLLVHGVIGAMIHVVANIGRALPDTPTGLLGLICLLTPILVVMGNKEREAQNLCFGCLAVFALIAVGLILVILKAQGGSNDRLRQMQHERLEAIGVRPIPDQADHSGRDNSRG